MQETSEFMLRRYKALWEAYCDAMNDPEVNGHLEAIQKAITTPAVRYWIPVSEASRQIARILKGEKPKYREGGNRWKMIWGVYESYLKLREKRVFQGKSVCFIASFAVLSPAPSLFFSFDRARRVIENIRSGKYDIEF